MSKKRLFMRISLIFVAFLISACAVGPKPIPKDYLEHDYLVSIQVLKCADRPQMMDSGTGGLIGLMVNASRASEMRTKMEGLTGDAVKELLRQSITAKLEDYFEVVDQEEAQLSVDINVTQWGWFVPTTAFGIKTGSYQFRISGLVNVVDVGQKETVASVSALSQQPMGNDPAGDVAQEALLKAIDDFTNQAIQVLLQNRS